LITKGKEGVIEKLKTDTKINNCLKFKLDAYDGSETKKPKDQSTLEARIAIPCYKCKSNGQ